MLIFWGETKSLSLLSAHCLTPPLAKPRGYTVSKAGGEKDKKIQCCLISVSIDTLDSLKKSGRTLPLSGCHSDVTS